MTENSTTTERDLGRVEGKLDLLLVRFDKFEAHYDRKVDALTEKHTALESRLGKLELRVKLLAGGLGAVVMAYAGDLKSVLLPFIKSLI